MRITRIWPALTLGAVAAVVAASPGPAVAAPAACKKATDIEAIIDDSGSMSLSDSGRLRVQAMNLLMQALDGSTTLGAIEFGSTFDPAVQPAAEPVFAPAAIGPNAAAMKTALDTKIQADAGSTDYNAAFTAGRAANSDAQARIFLTDGGHNMGAYADAHLNPSPQAQTPTYVIGFGSGLAGSADQARLQKIADDTGGRYFPLPDNTALQSVMNEISTALTCQSPPKTFSDSLGQGKRKVHSVRLTKKAKSAQIALSWSNPLDRFKIAGLRIVRGHKVVATAARKRHLKVKVHKGATFTVVKVSRVVKGKLRFAVKATRIGSGAPKVTLTTQVSQALRR
jgi:hypothetical protein